MKKNKSILCYNYMMKLPSIYIYGAGKRYRFLCSLVDDLEIDILGVIDSNIDLLGKKVCGHTILNKKDIKSLKNPNICISIEDKRASEEVYEYLKSINPSVTIIPYETILVYLLCNIPSIYTLFKNGEHKVNKEKSVYFDCPNGLALGGVETWSVNLCLDFNKRGMNSKLLLPNTPKTIMHSFTDQDLLWELNVQSGFINNKDDIIEYLKALLSCLPCTVITCNTDAMFLASVIIKNYYPELIDIIAVIHNRTEQLIYSHILWGEYIDKYVCVSKEIAEDIKDYNVEQKIYNIHIPFHCLNNLNRSYTLEECAPIKICYVGRIVREQKRADLMLLILNELKLRNVNFICEIAGAGDYIEIFKNYIEDEQKKGEHTLDVIGELPQSAMSSFYMHQDIYLNCSDYEGNCISKLEAMGCGVVPIVTNTSGIEGIVMDGVNGYVVPLEDYMTIVDRIVYLYNNRSIIPFLGNKAHETALPISDKDNHLKEWISILSSNDVY